MSEQNVELVRQIYAHFNRHDYGAMWELMAPDMEMCFIDWGPEKRTVVGREGAAEWFSDAFASLADFRMEPERLIDMGELVVAAIYDTGRGKASGVEVDLHIFGVWTIREGKAVRFEIFETLDDALRAAERLAKERG